jgi:lysophospholipase L1-like esterase
MYQLVNGIGTGPTIGIKTYTITINQKILFFQGDSITDGGRPHEREVKSLDEALGHGYVKILAGRIPLSVPQARWKVLNRGISGHKVTQLLARWQTHAINLKPDILSILIGVNDVWHGLSSREEFDGVPVDLYERTYRLLLDSTRERLPDVKLVLCEPFLIQGNAWTEEFQQGVMERQQVVRSLVDDYHTAFVPFQAAFEQALANFTVQDLAPDGVHPTNLGNTIMADAWMNAVAL